MRTKEYAHDYRYFPEPDLVPLAFDDSWIESARAALPELPAARRQRLMERFGLPEYDAGVLTDDKAVADYFDAVVAAGADAKTASNWMMGEFLRLLNATGQTPAEAKLRPEGFVELLKLVEAGTINRQGGKSVFETMFRTGKPAAQVVKEEGLGQISDEGELARVITEIVEQHADLVAQIRAGKDASFKFLVGQAMKATRGRANPELVNRLLRQAIER
jgi:aspartyl-tRNA(Asn)/glutamyl-tRNA(Gln) amidotransferase subunit B